MGLYIFDAAAKTWQEFQGKLGQAFVTLKEDHPLLTSLTNPRIRVDEAQTSFFEGNQFRTFKAISVTSSTPWTFKMIRPVNCVLLGLELAADNGKLKLEVFRSTATQPITESAAGTWSEVLPLIPQNDMTERPLPYYESQVQLLAGGTISGGQLRDFENLNGTSVPSKTATITGGTQDERGVAEDTIGYYRISTTDTGPVTGKLKFRWEERP